MNQKKAKKILQNATVSFMKGHYTAAREIINGLLKAAPKHSGAHNLAGLLEQLDSNHQTAASHFKKALQREPKNGTYHYNLGISYLKLNQLEEAHQSFLTTLSLFPEYAPAHTNIGVYYLHTNQYQQALKHTQTSLQLSPNNPDALSNLGLIYEKLGDPQQALEIYTEALKNNPQIKIFYVNAAKLYLDDGHAVEAIPLLETALTLAPNYTKAHSNLANAYLAVGDHDKAIQHYKKALSCAPDNAIANSNYLLSLHYKTYQSVKQNFEDHLAWATNHCSPPHTHPAPPPEECTKRLLRIGYLSPDFRKHPVAYFIEPILRHHSAETVEIYCYSNVQHPDIMTQNLQAMQHLSWREIAHMDDAEAAALIQADGIDILVDLAGHTSHHRLTLFSLKPAPLQVTYLGYPDTTGLQQIDYRLTDQWADPPGMTDHLHSEQLYRLPGGFLTYSHPDDCPHCAPLPCRAGNPITFGSFNMISKVNIETIAAWAHILTATPNSRLIIKARGLTDDAVTTLLTKFATHGIDAARITCLPFTATLREHLELYQHIDIALDPFPYNGTTTTFEALWMGRPVITLAGATHVGRVGASILSRLNLEHLIAHSVEDYIARATQLASNPAQLEQLSSTLRERMIECRLLDGQQFTRMLERGYRWMWQKHCLKQGDPSIIDTLVAPIVLENNISLVVPQSIEDQTTYTLLEQEKWPDPAIRFIAKFCGPAMRVIDLDAHYGEYTIPLAQAVGKDGKVLSLVEDTLCAELLRRTVQLNDTPQVTVVSQCRNEHDDAPDNDDIQATLSAFCHAAPSVALIRACHPASMLSCVTDEKACLNHMSPLLMCNGLADNSQNDMLVQELTLRQFRFYRLLPTMHILVPLEQNHILTDGETFFACQKILADQLMDRGLLLEKILPTSLPHHNFTDCIDGFLSFPYGQQLHEHWRSAPELPSRDSYFAALGLYKTITTTTKPDPCGLFAAYEKIKDVVEKYPSLSRFLSLTRVAFDCGQYSHVVELLQGLYTLFLEAPDQLTLEDEPFLPPCPRYDAISPGNELGNWILSSLVEQLIATLSPSTFTAKRNLLDYLTLIHDLGFITPEFKRRLYLLHLRFGMQPLHPPQKAYLSEIAENNNFLRSVIE